MAAFSTAPSWRTVHLADISPCDESAPLFTRIALGAIVKILRVSEPV